MPVREFKALSFFKQASQVRHSLPSIQEMADSLKAHGQLQGVAAHADGTVIFGHRRVAGAALAGLDGLWVDIHEGPISAAEIKLIQLVENEAREPLNPYEVSVAVKALKDQGTELKKIAQGVGKGPTWATRYMSPYKCIEEVFKAFEQGKICITDCEAMAKATPEEQRQMLEARLSGTATRDDIARQSKRKRNPDKVKVSRIQFPLPGGVTITITGHGLALDAAIEALVDGLKAMKKSQSDGLDAKTFMAVMQAKTKGGQ